MPGRFLEGNVRDRSVEQAKFIDVAKGLVPGLNKSSYVPAKSLAEADLLLVVHWGVTTSFSGSRMLDMRDPQDVYDLRQSFAIGRAEEIAAALEQSGPGSPVNPERALSTGLTRQYQDDLQFRDFEMETKNSPHMSSVAELLGFSNELAKDARRPVSSELARTLIASLERDRYFIVVMAYDWQRWLKEKKMVRMWVSRLSIPSPGINFPIAVRRMNLAGADSFGTSNPELVMVATRKKKQSEKVVVGDLIFVGFEKEQKSEKGK
ncbi:MAG: hypothetical protein QM715_00705 [Nibricoccus sp.]